MREGTFIRRLIPALAAAIAALSFGPGPAAASRLADPPPGFSSANVRIGGTSFHYVRGGSGPPIILLHGFPEDWAAYRAIMPRLAGRFTIVAVDLPGLGASGPSRDGYAKATLARHVHDLAESLKLERPYLVGHDLGGHVAYAYVRQFPKDLRGAMILDTPVPGLAGWNEALAGAWHVGFIQVPGLAEKLVAGRQSAFLGWFLDIGRFTPGERAYFTRAYGAPQLHAAFETFRSFSKDAEWNSAQRGSNAIPLTVAVGENFGLAKLLPILIGGYESMGMTDVVGATIPQAKHYVVTDNPDSVAALIERRAGSVER